MKAPPQPTRGFARAEFEARTERAQRAMHAARLDTLLLTTEPQLRYFSGFLTQFWLSPTRPWYRPFPLISPSPKTRSSASKMASLSRR